MLWIPVQLWSLGCYKLHQSSFKKQSHHVMGWVNIKLDIPLSKQISTFLWIYPQIKIFNFHLKFFPLWAITRIPQHRQLNCLLNREAELAQILSKVKSTIALQSSPYSMVAYSRMHRHSLLTAKQRRKWSQTFLESRLCSPVSAISHMCCWFYWLL